MTFYNNKLEYRVTLDTELNLFIVFDKHDENHFATGRTIEQAVQELAKTALFEFVLIASTESIQ